MNLLAQMGYEEGGLKINGQGINNPIMVKDRTRYQGLGYGNREFGDCSKLFEVKKSLEDDMSHQDGSDNVNLSPKGDECFNECCKGIFMSSSNPHCQSYNPRDRYKCHGNFPNIDNFDYLWDMYPCIYSDEVYHCVVDCEQ